jgi:hypothetical protein
MRKRFLPPKSLKQLAEFLQEKWNKIPLETAQNLYESVPTKDCGCIGGKKLSIAILI